MEAMVVVSMAGQTTVMAEQAKKVVAADKGRWVDGVVWKWKSVNKACNYYQLGKTVHIDWKLAMEAMLVMGMAEQATMMAEEGRRGESSINLGDIEEDQRFGYVDSLLKAGSESVASVNALNGSIQEV
ncbi:hypothetical protein Acr_00g0079260 [Actinidia rufa]|uniref:Uncharacterized protein n=1 Tax=Actinidia rufa TaxID=165716 RepID=A0A7J0DU42_9ERIC|nr:hypothetical protein Acr_00g0079260 [Actinidia rufa]